MFPHPPRWRSYFCRTKWAVVTFVPLVFFWGLAVACKWWISVCVLSKDVNLFLERLHFLICCVGISSNKTSVFLNPFCLFNVWVLSCVVHHPYLQTPPLWDTLKDHLVCSYSLTLWKVSICTKVILQKSQNITQLLFNSLYFCIRINPHCLRREMQKILIRKFFLFTSKHWGSFFKLLLWCIR